MTPKSGYSLLYCLGTEANRLALWRWRNRELTNSIENDLELPIILLFELFEFAAKLSAGSEHLAQLNERAQSERMRESRDC